MKVVYWIFGVLLAGVVLIFGLQVLASETGEVIVLHTLDADGGEAETRLWVVDYQGSAYLRRGSSTSGWYARVAAAPAVKVTRGGVTAPYLAVSEPALTVQINALMHEKYGWRDRLIGLLVGSREDAMPVRLQAAP